LVRLHTIQFVYNYKLLKKTKSLTSRLLKIKYFFNFLLVKKYILFTLKVTFKGFDR